MPPSVDTVDISVIVPAYNGEHTIVDCLTSIYRATENRRCEIIVADSSSDATPDLVRKHFPGAILIRSPRQVPAGTARNLGSSAARGRLLFFTDQDCIVPPDWIDSLEAHFADSAISAAGGAVGVRNLENASGCALYFLEFLNHFPGKGTAQYDANFLIGCNFACRREVVRAVRFPDQTLGEDILFSEMLRKHGFRRVYDPRIAVLHHNRRGWKVFFDYNRKMGRAAADYHRQLKLWWAVPFLQFPSLALLAPFGVLPTVGWTLLRLRSPYLLKFLLLLPMCFLGNLTWGMAFRRQAGSEVPFIEGSGVP
jgi:GT2 family glycosyltransferase